MKTVRLGERQTEDFLMRDFRISASEKAKQVTPLPLAKTDYPRRASKEEGSMNLILIFLEVYALKQNLFFILNLPHPTCSPDIYSLVEVFLPCHEELRHRRVASRMSSFQAK